jgi:hypothetical protein
MANVLTNLVSAFAVVFSEAFLQSQRTKPNKSSTKVRVQTKGICDAIPLPNRLSQLIAVLPFLFHSISLRFLLSWRLLFSSRLSSFSTINNLPP